MKKTISAILATAAGLLMLTGCSSSGTAQGEAKTYKYTSAEVYTKSCVKCHGAKGEGVPEKKGPALNDRQSGELELDLFDVKNGGTNQSSGTEHDIMEHNMQKLIEKGYDYDIKAMADYIEKNFYQK
jgi:cytochrome c553